ncbi:MAG: helix-turn-helix domain-containing protein [Elainella sp.]
MANLICGVIIFDLKEAAHALGLTSKTVSNWERGVSEATLTVVQIKQLCELLGVELGELPDRFRS